MPKVWKSAWGEPAPREVEVEIVGYPNKDAEGDKQFTNTHFASKEDAWARHLREHAAGASMTLGQVREAERALARAKESFLEASRKSVEASEAWKDEQRAPHPNPQKGG